MCAITPLSVHQALEGLTAASATPAGRPTGSTGKGPCQPPSYQVVWTPQEPEHAKVLQASLQDAHEALPDEVCQDPLPLISTVISVLASMEESLNLANKDREHISETICYLAERLAALQHVANKLATINMADHIPRKSTRGRCGP